MKLEVVKHLKEIEESKMDQVRSGIYRSNFAIRENWDYLETMDRRYIGKHGQIQKQEDMRIAKACSLRPVRHRFKNQDLKENGEFVFDQIILFEYETKKIVAVFEDDEMEEANQHFMDGMFWHVDCYMP